MDGQDQVGVMPRISISKSINQRIKLQTLVENRVGFRTTAEGKQINRELTDFMISIADKNANGARIIAAYTFRTGESGQLHRLSQYMSFVDDRGNHRLANRIGMDQSFTSGSSMVLRFRYRFVWEKSLNGGKINANEFYLKFGSELIYSINPNLKNLIEFRLLPHLGYEINASSKLEVSIDHRFRSVIDSISDSRSWIKLSWYHSL